MSIQWREDNKRWRFRIKQKGPDGKQQDMRVTLPAGISERRAKQMDRILTPAIKFCEFQYLDVETRRVCIQLYRNQGWVLPPALINAVGNHGSAEEVNLAKAIEYCMTDPEVQRVKDPSRYKQSFVHVLAYWGSDFPVGRIGARQIKEYMFKREKEGAAGSTINKERQALSKMFKVLIQAGVIDRNVVQDTAPADERESQRDVYISCKDFIMIVEQCPTWAQPVFETLYLTGMRREEAIELTWDRVNLKSRIITLTLGKTKEKRSKRVPIHKTLVQILEEVGEARSSSHDRVFLRPIEVKGESPEEPPSVTWSAFHEDSLSRCWRHAVEALGFDRKPRVHDLRHCRLTNAARSGVHPATADAITGHGDKKKALQSLYTSISDKDLVKAIDMMQFDTGDTEIWVKK